MKIIEKMSGHCPFYSLEFFPPKEREGWPVFFAAVNKLRGLDPLFASVTYGAGGSTQDYTLEITAKLAESGFTPMAHLTCVGAAETSIREYIRQLLQSGVTNILALRGDVPNGKEHNWEDCEFSHASDLVRFVRKEFPQIGIAVAAYLTPHPESASFSTDRIATAQKLAMGSDFAVTQLFFDYREYFEYVKQMRALGVDKPILPGVLPIQSLASIKRVLSLSGCNIPAKLYLTIEEAESKGGSEAVLEAGIRFAVEQVKRLIDGGAPGIHLYTLNKADMCLRIAEAVGKL